MPWFASSPLLLRVLLSSLSTSCCYLALLLLRPRGTHGHICLKRKPIAKFTFRSSFFPHSSTPHFVIGIRPSPRVLLCLPDSDQLPAISPSIPFYSQQQQASMSKLWTLPASSPTPNTPVATSLNSPKLKNQGKRIAQIVRLKPDCVDEYKACHAKVWPEVLKQIKACNIEDCPSLPTPFRYLPSIHPSRQPGRD